VEPDLTDRDIEMLLLSDEALIQLGAMLGLKAKISDIKSLEHAAALPGC